MRFLLRLIIRWPFTTLGLITFALFFVAPMLGIVESGSCSSSGSGAVSSDGTVIYHQESSSCTVWYPASLKPVVNLLILPLWFMRLMEMSTGIGFLPWPLQLPLALPLLFLPYVAVDLLIRRLRGRYKTGSGAAGPKNAGSSGNPEHS